MGGVMCGGGVFPMSYFHKHKDDPDFFYEHALDWFLPDDKYEEFERLIREGKSKEAWKIVEKYGRSLV